MGGHAGAGDRHKLIFEEGVGPVVVDVERHGEHFNGTLTLEANIETKTPAPDTAALAAVLFTRAWLTWYVERIFWMRDICHIHN